MADNNNKNNEETRYNNWLKTLKEYKESIEKDMEEIMRCKFEMQKMKEEFIERFGEGQYIRDKKRIIISAPEIIIGDVYRDGTLRDYGSKVIMRTSHLYNECYSSIDNKSPRIRNICACPGIDGNEERILAASYFTVQSESITLQSEKTAGTYSTVPTISRGEINIMADEHINIAAQPPMAERKKRIEETIEDKKRRKADLEKTVLPTTDSIKAKLQTYGAAMDLGEKDPKLGQAPEFQDICKKKNDAIGKDLYIYQDTISKLTAIEQEIKNLTKQKTEIEASIARGYTPSSIDIKAGTTNITSKNEDNKMCTYNGSGVKIFSKYTKITAPDDKDGTLNGSGFLVNTQSIQMTTCNQKKGAKPGEFDIPAEGNIQLCSKDIRLSSMDFEKKGQNVPVTRKALTKGGRIRMQAENLVLFTNDIEGKATGRIEMNSKKVSLKTDDINPADGKNVGPTDDGLIQLFAPKIIGGHIYTKNKEKSKILLASGNVFAKGMYKTEVSQGQCKALLQMEEGKAYLKTDENEITGKLTVDSRTSFKNLVTAEKAAIKSLEVKEYIKTPHSTEGSPAYDGGETPDPSKRGFIDWDEEYEAIKKKEQEEKEKEEEIRKQRQEEEKKIEEQRKKDEEIRKKWLKDNAEKMKAYKKKGVPAGCQGMEDMIILIKQE